LPDPGDHLFHQTFIALGAGGMSMRVECIPRARGYARSVVAAVFGGTLFRASAISSPVMMAFIAGDEARRTGVGPLGEKLSEREIDGVEGAPCARTTPGIFLQTLLWREHSINATATLM
jgi:hypothetical protein